MKQTENASGASGAAVLEEAIARSGDDRISGFEEHRELPAVRLFAGFELGRIGGNVRLGARGGIALEIESDNCGNASRAVIRQIPQGLRSVFDSVVFQMNHNFAARGETGERIGLFVFDFKADRRRTRRDFAEQFFFQKTENRRAADVIPVRRVFASGKRRRKTGDGFRTVEHHIHKKTPQG